MPGGNCGHISHVSPPTPGLIMGGESEVGEGENPMGLRLSLSPVLLWAALVGVPVLLARGGFPGQGRTRAAALLRMLGLLSSPSPPPLGTLESPRHSLLMMPTPCFCVAC